MLCSGSGGSTSFRTHGEPDEPRHNQVDRERHEYFGKKDELFGIVLACELAAVMDAVPITGVGVEAVVDYAGRVFDYHSRHPELARLVFWEGLEGTEPTALAARNASRRAAVLQAIESYTRSLG